METRETISLCMIVKNEERSIERSLSSVSGHVDEIIVVDTGSRDSTRDVARRFHAKVYDFPWIDDFSAARNHSISQASGSWILVLDADECLAQQDARQLRRQIQTAAHGVKLIQRSYLWSANFVCSVPNPKDYELGRDYSDCVDVFVIRLFRNEPSIRYQGRVHELVEPVFQARGLQADQSSLVIHHFGKVGDSSQLEAKKLLYLDLGRQKTLDQPNDAMAHFELGVQLFELKRYEESIVPFKKAYDLNRTYDLSLLYVAKAYHQSGSMAEARRYYQKCLKLSRNSDRVLFDYANFVRDQGQLTTALKLYQKLLAANPNHALAVFNMGGVHIRLGEIERGFETIKKALRLNPDNETFHENFGRLALQGYALEDAARLLEDYLRRFPNAARCASILGAVCFKLGRLKDASEWSARVLRLQPADRQALLTKANAEFTMGHGADAEKSYRAVLEIDPQNLDAMMNLAALAESRNELSPARRWYQRILDRNPQHAEALKRLARIQKPAPGAHEHRQPTT
jgi:tetratricopeptide (TPR) repeat protein